MASELVWKKAVMTVDATDMRMAIEMEMQKEMTMD